MGFFLSLINSKRDKTDKTDRENKIQMRKQWSKRYQTKSQKTETISTKRYREGVKRRIRTKKQKMQAINKRTVVTVRDTFRMGWVVGKMGSFCFGHRN